MKCNAITLRGEEPPIFPILRATLSTNTESDQSTKNDQPDEVWTHSGNETCVWNPREHEDETLKSK